MKRKKPVVLLEPIVGNNKLVVLSFDYDPAIIIAVRKISGAELITLNGKRHWAIPRLSIESLVALLGASRVKSKDEELTASIGNVSAVAPNPTHVRSDFRPLFPTWTERKRPEKGLTKDDFQATGSTWIIDRTQGIQGDSVGYGKCKMLLDAINYVHNTTNATNTIVLVLCKTSITDVWKTEATKFAPDVNVHLYRGTKTQRKAILHDFQSVCTVPGIHLFVVSYGTFRNDYKDITLWLWDWAILDEADVAKSSPLNGNQSQIAQVIHTINAKRKYAVTANIIVNDSQDAWNILTWLGIEDRSWNQFEAETLTTITINPHQYVEVKKVVASKPDGLRKLQHMLTSNMIARSDDLDLPAKIQQDIIVHLKPDEAKFYVAAAKQFMEDEDGNEVSAPELLSDLDNGNGTRIPNTFVRKLRLKQITSSIETFVGVPYLSSKIVAVKELVATAVSTGKKVLVGTQFRSVVTALERELAEYNPAVIHGGISGNAKVGQASPRSLQERKFQTDPTCHVFIGSVAACREGLTLTAGSVIIHVDKEWSPVRVNQFEGRAQRISQEQHVIVYTLKAMLPNGDKTVDFDIAETLDNKNDVIEELTGKRHGD